ncbi:MAG: hypothetical protein ACXVAX_09710 [Pseudobdellovibrio sp.]
MKKLYILLSLFLGLQAQASTLNITNAACRGSGTLDSHSLFIPNLDFTSQRTLKDGRIDAKSTVSILGFDNSATATLYFQQTSDTQFNVLDLTKPVGKGYQIAGNATCNNGVCSFEAKVMNGSLYLKETWVPTTNGFSVRDGFQNFNGIQSTYTAEFICTRI